MKNILLILLFSFCTLSYANEPPKHSVKPKNGFVPNKETAIKIAEAIWLPIYGEAIYRKKPFGARLIKGIWYVSGSMPRPSLGGVPIAEIDQKDGRIIRVSHGK